MASSPVRYNFAYDIVPKEVKQLIEQKISQSLENLTGTEKIKVSTKLIGSNDRMLNGLLRSFYNKKLRVGVVNYYLSYEKELPKNREEFMKGINELMGKDEKPSYFKKVSKERLKGWYAKELTQRRLREAVLDHLKQDANSAQTYHITIKADQRKTDFDLVITHQDFIAMFPQAFPVEIKGRPYYPGTLTQRLREGIEFGRDVMALEISYGDKKHARDWWKKENRIERLEYYKKISELLKKDIQAPEREGLLKLVIRIVLEKEAYLQPYLINMLGVEARRNNVFITELLRLLKYSGVNRELLLNKLASLQEEGLEIAIGKALKTVLLREATFREYILKLPAKPETKTAIIVDLIYFKNLSFSEKDNMPVDYQDRLKRLLGNLRMVYDLDKTGKWSSSPVKVAIKRDVRRFVKRLTESDLQAFATEQAYGSKEITRTKRFIDHLASKILYKHGISWKNKKYGDYLLYFEKLAAGRLRCIEREKYRVRIGQYKLINKNDPSVWFSVLPLNKKGIILAMLSEDKEKAIFARLHPIRIADSREAVSTINGLLQQLPREGNSVYIISNDSTKGLADMLESLLEKNKTVISIVCRRGPPHQKNAVIFDISNKENPVSISSSSPIKHSKQRPEK